MKARLPGRVYHLVERLVSHGCAGLCSASESEEDFGEPAVPFLVAGEGEVTAAPVSAQGSDDGAGYVHDVAACQVSRDLVCAGPGVAPVEHDHVVLVELDQDAGGIHGTHGDPDAVR